MKNKIEYIKRIIDDYEYISFDIFDTLISRNFPKPSNIFNILGRDNKNAESSFSEQRIMAEKEARIMSEKEEVTLPEIYKNIKTLSNKQDSELIQNEEELEITLSVAIKNNKKLLDYCNDKHKKIIIISDMYLNKSVIKEILDKNEIKYYKLYVSSDIKLTKETGNLFLYALKDMNISNEQLLHIGDNYQSDYCIPMMLGIKAINVDKYVPKIKGDLTNHDKFNCQCLNIFINNNLDRSKEYFYKRGYETFGPLLYGYCKWLDENFKENNYDNILFLSRDGYIMKKAFELISKRETKYVYASRRALIVPTIWKCKNLSDIKKIMNIPRTITIGALLEKLGLDSKKYEKNVEKYNLKLSDEISSQDIEEEKLLFYKEIEKDIYENSKNEYNNLINYFKKIGVKNKTAIIDIGWHGNMQNAIEKIIGLEKINAKIDGYYVGVAPQSEKQDALNMRGYLFSKQSPTLYYSELFFNSMFEMIFMAPHGSVKKYIDNDVELYPYEYESSQTKKDIELFQKGALDFIKEYDESVIKEYIDFTNVVASYNLFELGNNPSKEDIEMFGNMLFYDDGIHTLVQKRKITEYIKNYKQFLEDFRNSQWKPAFLKKMFHININYFYILKYLKQKKDKNKKE